LSAQHRLLLLLPSALNILPSTSTLLHTTSRLRRPLLPLPSPSLKYPLFATPLLSPSSVNPTSATLHGVRVNNPKPYHSHSFTNSLQTSARRAHTTPPPPTMSSTQPFGNAVSLENRCGESKSPYVRSHMDNPTAWQLWSPETLELARRTNRLLFVSIGYSACHWVSAVATIHSSREENGKWRVVLRSED
jgi:hypothetical protein